MTVLVTGAAGFIGFHASLALLAAGETVVGVDSVNAYYDPSLKEARLKRLAEHGRFTFHRLDIAERDVGEPGDQRAERRRWRASASSKGWTRRT